MQDVNIRDVLPGETYVSVYRSTYFVVSVATDAAAGIVACSMLVIHPSPYQSSCRCFIQHASVTPTKSCNASLNGDFLYDIALRCDVVDKKSREG